MERLTIPDVRLDGNTIKRSIIDAQKVKECAMELYWRLKDIEDAIADEESEEYDLSRLREMVQADKDERCVMLPCRVGEKVYDISSGYITEKTVISIPFMLSKSVNYLCLHAINNRDAATTIEHASIGKTVFLTREAAEEALKEREKDEP